MNEIINTIHKNYLSVLFSGPSNMARKLKSIDWDQHPLGPVHNWPQSLLTTLDIIMNCRYPMFVSWGESQTFLYNDAYAPILGTKESYAMGKSFPILWPEIWDELAPLYESVKKGNSTRADDMRLLINRYNFLEETYFTFSYGPVRDEAGEIEGLFCACFETTQNVLSERRSKCLQRLMERLIFATNSESVFNILGGALRYNARDIPFALLYRLDDSSIKLFDKIRTINSDLDSDKQLYELVHKVWAEGRPSLVPLDENHFSQQCLHSISKSVSHVYIVPLPTQANERSPGCVVFGVSRFLFFEDHYKNYFNQLVSQVASTLQAKRAQYEAELIRQELYDFFMQAPSPMCIIAGPNHVYTLANAPYEKLIGRCPVGKSVREVFSPEERSGLFEILDHVYLTGESFIGHEMPFYKKK